MDGSRFDRLTRELGAGISRRAFVARALGIGGATVIAGGAIQSAEAARRGFSRPTRPRLEPRCQVGADCPPCQCTGQQSIQCYFCEPDFGTCALRNDTCPGCCETVDDVGVCGCNDV
jgi:hypothetical protein